MFPDEHRGLLRAGMTDDVGQRLLRHAVEHRAPAVVQNLDTGVGGETDPQFPASGQGADEGAQRGDQPEIVEQRGPQFAGEAMHGRD